MAAITSVKSRFTTIIAILVVGFFLFGAAALQTLSELKVNGPLYQRIVQGKDLIADILPPPEYIIESYLVTLRLAGALDNADKERLLSRFDALEREYGDRHAFWIGEELDDATKAAFLRRSYDAATRFYELANKVFLPAVRSGKTADAQTALADLTAAYEEHRRAIDDVVAMTNKRVAGDEQSARSSIQVRTWILIGVFIASFAVAVVYAGRASRSIQNELGGEPAVAYALAQSISQGDLTKNIHVAAENSRSLMHAMRSMHDTLRALISDTAIKSERISSMAQKLSKITEQARNGMHAQQSEMDRVTAAATETASTSQEVARNCSDAANAAQESSKKTEEGVQTMTRVRQSIDNLANDVDRAAEVIQGLKSESTKIGSVVDVINGIAEQTNLLALNAAIEAARAGEQGRGFAVVADEVRTLASRTQQSTKEIQQMVQSLQSGTANAVGVIERERSNAQLTVQNVVAAETLLTDIRNAVRQFTGLTDQISSAARQQSDVSEEINRNIVGVHRVAQDSLAGAEQVAEVSRDLAELANELQSTVAHFKIS